MERHPQITHRLIETLHHLLPISPREIFLIAATAIRQGASVGYQNESLAVKDVVEMIQQLIADHREVILSGSSDDSACLDALLEVLDLFVEAGWPAARSLTHRLEEIYR